MATIYVNSGASGANNGTSWTDAYTSLASAASAAAGDTVKVHKTHSETALTATINFSNGTVPAPVKLLCVDKDAADALSTGAVVGWNTSSVGLSGNVYAYGITFQQSAALLVFAGTTQGVMTLENCTVTVTGSSGPSLGGTRVRHVWRNVTLNLSGSSSAGVGVLTTSPRFDWLGGTYTMRSTQTTLFTTPNNAADITVRGVSVGGGTLTNLFAGFGSAETTAVFTGCNLPAYTNVWSTAPDNTVVFVRLEGCATGTISAPPVGPTLLATREGSIAATLTRYRSGGASDGVNATAYSWAMTTDADADAPDAALASPPMVLWADAGAQTVTVHVASGVTLTDEEFWVEVYSPSEAGTPTAQGAIRSTRVGVVATPAALTSDGTSTWTGSGVGTAQKVAVSISPTVAGPVTVRAFLAKPSMTAYLDPKPVVA